MAKCPSCGARVYDTDDVCMDCGTSLRGPQAAPPPPPPADGTAPIRVAETATDSGLTMTAKVDENLPPLEVPFPDQLVAEPAVISRLADFLEDPDKEWAISPIAEELTVILLGHKWQWPQFDEWHSHFQQARYFPDSWKGLEYTPDPPQPETEERLATFAGLSESAKRLLIRMGALTRKSAQVVSPYDATRKTEMSPNAIERAMHEIQGVGWGTMSLPIADRLTELKKDQMVAIAEKYGVDTSGTKAVLGERLGEEVDRDLLLQELPPDKREELWGIEPEFGDLEDPYVDFELQRIRVLAWDVRTLISTLNRAYSAMQWDEADLRVWANDDCPECKKHVDETFTLSQLRNSSVTVPPYHPGCDCDIQVENVQHTVHVSPSAGQSGGASSGKASASGCGCAMALAPVVMLVMALLLLAQ
jgi:hypothetical protein